MLRASCYWPSSHCTLAQKIVPCPRPYVTTVCRGCCIRTRVCTATTPLHSLYEVDRQSQPNRRGYHLLLCFQFLDDLLSYFQKEEKSYNLKGNGHVWIFSYKMLKHSTPFLH